MIENLMGALAVIVKLEKALKPFADLEIASSDVDDMVVVPGITVAHIRAARQAMDVET